MRAAQIARRVGRQREREALDHAQAESRNAPEPQAGSRMVIDSSARERFGTRDGTSPRTIAPDVARVRVAAEPGHDGARGEDVDDRARRVEAAARQPLVLGHQRLEDLAEHLRIDVRAGGVATRRWRRRSARRRPR